MSPQVRGCPSVRLVGRRADTTAEGAEIWSAAETAYNDRVARIENQIISRLRDKLATAKNAQEMFRVFSRFNTLFVRPKASAPSWPR